MELLFGNYIQCTVYLYHRSPGLPVDLDLVPVRLVDPYAAAGVRGGALHQKGGHPELLLFHGAKGYLVWGLDHICCLGYLVRSHA